MAWTSGVTTHGRPNWTRLGQVLGPRSWTQCASSRSRATLPAGDANAGPSDFLFTAAAGCLLSSACNASRRSGSIYAGQRFELHTGGQLETEAAARTTSLVPGRAIFSLLPAMPATALVLLVYGICGAASLRLRTGYRRDFSTASGERCESVAEKRSKQRTTAYTQGS
jgi:hypothetical protein